MPSRDPFFSTRNDDDDLFCLDAGNSGGASAPPPSNGDNSLSVEDRTCDNDGVLRLDARDNGVNSLPPQGCTGNIISHDGSDMATDGNTSVPSGGNVVPQDWRMSIPPGMKFRPTDEELVINYLELESFGITFPSDGIINRLDVYDYQPHQLQNMVVDHGDGKMYFYTNVKKIGKSKSDRKIRSRPGCHWKATQAPKPIKGSVSGNIHRYKMSLAYYEEEGKKTQWLMQEYKLKPRSSSPKEHDLVLAVIYYHQRKG